jgi:SpoVK/Ycf46/Vps4 family AAA+-type ATPase
MIWYFVIDAYYYEHTEEITTSGVELLVAPDKNELKETLRKKKIFEVLAPFNTPNEYSDLFTVIEVPNKYGIFTTTEMEYLEKLSSEERKKAEEKLITEKTGLKISKPDIPLDNLIGMENVKKYAIEVKEIKDDKLKPKGVFLVGLPGTGKSFSAKVMASALGYWLVEFNVSKILESKNPVFLIHSIFRHLERLSREGQKFILWIDEIEKMFAGGTENEKRILGQLLTVMNDLNTHEGYQVDGIFWVTANNIKDILMRNPEFLRRGRFDQLFFVDAPRFDNARKIFAFYAKKYGINSYLSKSKSGFTEDAIDLTKRIYTDLSIGSPDASRFAYVPAEIEAIVKDLKRREVVNQRFLQVSDNEKREMIKMLYTKHVRNKLQSLLYSEGLVLSSDEERSVKELANFHEKKLKEGNVLLTYIDLASVIATIEPLSLSMKDAIAIIRSNERFFTPVD